MAQAPGIYDVIIIDFPDPNAIELSKLYSQHFYGLLRKNWLQMGSRSAINLTDTCQRGISMYWPYYGVGGLASLPYHDNVPLSRMGLVVGGRDDRYTPETLHNKISSITDLQVNTQYLTHSLIHASLAWKKATQVKQNRSQHNFKPMRLHLLRKWLERSEWILMFAYN